MLENEKKIPLTKDEFLYLWQIIAPDSVPKKQINYYYDTQDFSMNKHGITLRIRQKNETYTATIKQHNYGGKEYSKETFKKVKNEFDTSFFPFDNIMMHGSLVTERIVLFRHPDLELVLDKNTYLGFIDYEMEIEFLPENEERVEQLCLLLSAILKCKFDGIRNSELLDRQKKSMSKSERFFDKLMSK